MIVPCDLLHGRLWFSLGSLPLFFLAGQDFLLGQPPKEEAVPPIPAPRVLLEAAEDVTILEDAAQQVRGARTAAPQQPSQATASSAATVTVSLL